MELAERLVHAAEQAVDDAARVRAETPQGATVDGYVSDFARLGVGAAIDVLADDMEAHDGAGHAALLRLLAQAVRDVRAVEAV